jgi:flavonol synthase
LSEFLLPFLVLREANEVYANYVREVADKLFTCLSLGLGLRGDALKEAGGGEEMVFMMKINYYPPCPQPDLTLGVVAHTDFSALTLLVPNEVPGLQVLKDDRWIDAKYIPNALIVHIGDQIEVIFFVFVLFIFFFFSLVNSS